MQHHAPVVPWPYMVRMVLQGPSEAWIKNSCPLIPSPYYVWYKSYVGLVLSFSFWWPIWGVFHTRMGLCQIFWAWPPIYKRFSSDFGVHRDTMVLTNTDLSKKYGTPANPMAPWVWNLMFLLFLDTPHMGPTWEVLGWLRWTGQYFVTFPHDWRGLFQSCSVRDDNFLLAWQSQLGVS